MERRLTFSLDLIALTYVVNEEIPEGYMLTSISGKFLDPFHVHVKPDFIFEIELYGLESGETTVIQANSIQELLDDIRVWKYDGG